MITVKMQALKDFDAKLSNITPAVSKEIRKAINRGVREVRTTAITLIKKPSYGRVYGKKVVWRRVTKKQKASGRVRGNAKEQKIHIASKPGDAPNKDTGDLIRNIRVSTGRGNPLKGYYATVDVITPYAKRLEFGGSHVAKNGKKIYVAPRPFMRPAVAQNAKLINDLLRQAVRKALK